MWFWDRQWSSYAREVTAPTHVTCPAPDVERQLEAGNEDTLADFTGTITKSMSLALIRVERRVFLWIIVGRDIPNSQLGLLLYSIPVQALHGEEYNVKMSNSRFGHPKVELCGMRQMSLTGAHASPSSTSTSLFTSLSLTYTIEAGWKRAQSS